MFTRAYAASKITSSLSLTNAPLSTQRTFREIMFLQEVNNHENIIRYARFYYFPQLTSVVRFPPERGVPRYPILTQPPNSSSPRPPQTVERPESRKRPRHLPYFRVHGNGFARGYVGFYYIAEVTSTSGERSIRSIRVPNTNKYPRVKLPPPQ